LLTKVTARRPALPEKSQASIIISDRFTFLLAFVGHPGFDPGTLGLKETFNRLRCVGLVAHVV
jgi:hypothetical protein